VEETESFAEGGERDFAVGDCEGDFFHCVGWGNEFCESMCEECAWWFVIVVEWMA